MQIENHSKIIRAYGRDEHREVVVAARCYLVVPHADVGPDVIVDCGLLFIFRLQTHKIRLLLKT